MKYAALLLCLTAFAQEPPATARIQGRVVDQDGKPLARAQVGLAGMARGLGEKATTTGDDGTFLLEDIVPGSAYMLSARKNGYLTSMLGLQGAIGPNVALPGPPPTFTLKPDETLKAVLTLMEQGVVTGRITTPEGDPIPKISVQLRQARYNIGFLETVTIGSAETDDRGAFRITGLPRGRYYLVASRSGSQSRVMETVIGQESLTTFYPGVATLDRAQPIEVAAGSETKINLTMRRGGYYKLRATLGDASGAALANYGLSARRTDIELNFARLWTTDSKGQVEIPGLEPGDYTAYVTLRETPQGSLPVQQHVRFTIGTEDAVGVVLRIPGEGARLTGTVRPEEGELKLRINTDPTMGISASALANLADLPDDFYFSFAAVAMPGTPSSEWRTGNLRPNHSFELTGLDRGEYRLAIGGIPSGYYVKSVKQGDRDVTHKPVTMPGEPLQVIVSAKGAEVSGKLAEGNRNVALWTEKEDEGSVLHGIHLAVSDREGAFRFTGLPPGAYRIAAFSDSDRGLLWRHAFLDKFSGEAAKIEIAEGAKLIVEPPMVPAARFKEEFDKLP